MAQQLLGNVEPVACGDLGSVQLPHLMDSLVGCPADSLLEPTIDNAKIVICNSLLVHRFKPCNKEIPVVKGAAPKMEQQGALRTARFSRSS